MTIHEAVQAYIRAVSLARSAYTTRTYENAMEFFQGVMRDYHVNPEKTPVDELMEESILWLVDAMKVYAPATEKLYLSAVNGFYEFVAADQLAPINLPRVHALTHRRARRVGKRVPQFSSSAIEEILEAAETLKVAEYETWEERLIAYRDRAFLITLADTGLRVHEACKLRRGDLDWGEARALVIGKGDKQAVVRFSARATRALKDYLNVRASLDGKSGRKVTALPMFARHDKGAGTRVMPISTATGRNIVAGRVRQFLGEEAVGSITPHSFRHYFVTRVLTSSGNLKLAQELARHASVAVTQRYAHLNDDELNQGYLDAFEAQED